MDKYVKRFLSAVYPDSPDTEAWALYNEDPEQVFLDAADVIETESLCGEISDATVVSLEQSLEVATNWILRLHKEGTLSEGQAAKALSTDRVDFREKFYQWEEQREKFEGIG